jgi:uncharacterized protein
LEAVTAWAKLRSDIRGVALVGSHARGQPRADSDVDLLLLAENPSRFRDPAWLADLDLPPARWRDEEYGPVWSRRVWLASGDEIELSFAPLSWADVSPIDPGTRKVVSDGCRILYDPDGLLQRLTLDAPRPE